MFGGLPTMAMLFKRLSWPPHKVHLLFMRIQFEPSASKHYTKCVRTCGVCSLIVLINTD